MRNETRDPNEQYRTGIDAYRSVAKWVVSSFGVVAGALVVGVQLSSIGEVRGWRLFWSLLSLVVVFAGVLAIIMAAARLLTPMLVNYKGFAKSRDFKPLRDDIERDSAQLSNVLPGVKTAARLAQVYEEAITRLRTATGANEGARRTEATEQNLRKAQKYHDDLYEVMINVTWKGRFLRAKQMFRQTMVVLYVCVALVAAGAAAFAYFSSAPPKKEASGHAPIHVTVGGPRLLEWPRSCARLYFALGKLAQDEAGVGPLWPAGSLSDWDRKCGLRSRADVAHALKFLAGNQTLPARP